MGEGHSAGRGGAEKHPRRRDGSYSRRDPPRPWEGAKIALDHRGFRRDTRPDARPWKRRTGLDAAPAIYAVPGVAILAARARCSAARDRSRPSAVRGPVLRPPWSLQRPPRPFAGAPHAWPSRHLAPQRSRRVSAASSRRRWRSRSSRSRSRSSAARTDFAENVLGCATKYARNSSARSRREVNDAMLARSRRACAAASWARGSWGSWSIPAP